MAAGFLTRRAAKPRVRSDARGKPEEDDQYEIANLFPRTTGLPLTVWVSPRGRARHAAQFKVSLTPGRMDIGHTAAVGIRPAPRLIEGDLSPADFALVAQWIRLNEGALIENSGKSSAPGSYNPAWHSQRAPRQPRFLRTSSSARISVSGWKCVAREIRLRQAT